MTSGKEKRQTDRYAVEAPILCSYFNLPVSASAKTINFSRDGMYFVSEMEFHPGSAVLIQVKNGGVHQKMPENTEGMRQTTLAADPQANRAHLQVQLKAAPCPR